MSLSKLQKAIFTGIFVGVAVMMVLPNLMVAYDHHEYKSGMKLFDANSFEPQPKATGTPQKPQYGVE